MSVNQKAEGPTVSAGQFVPTRWTQVLRARGESAEAQAALGELCAAYWQPVFAFIRREGRDEETARDLTQAFFTQILASHGLKTVEPGRGRFRSYLLGAVKHFLAGERQSANTARRGGGQTPVSIQAGTSTNTTLELQIPDPAGAVSDAFFDHQWAVILVNRGLTALAAETEAEGKHVQFTVLKPWLAGEVPSLSQADAAQELGLTEGAVKVAIHRLRKRFRELIKAEIGHTVRDPEMVQEELRYLLEVLCASR